MTLGRALLIGADGMLGRAWRELLVARGVDHVDATFPSFDLTREEIVRATISPSFRWVINCAAWTDVDAAETNEAGAYAVNADGVARLAQACRSAGATLVHYSTDYVFSGRAVSPYRTDDAHEPVNAYGRTKAAGEQHLIASGDAHLTVRTSWLYAPWGKNFVRTIATLCRERPSLRVVDDQRGRPSSAEHVARTTLRLMELGAAGSGVAGIFQVTDGGETTWFDLARAVVAHVRPSCRVEPCRSADFPRPARRPACSVLDLGKTEGVLGSMESWTQNLALVLSKLEA